MKKKVLALVLSLVLVLAMAVVPASAANYDGINFDAVKGDYVYVNSYDNIVVCVQGEDGDEGLVGQANVGNVYGLVLFATADSTGALHLVVNAENNGWTNGFPTDDPVEPVAYDGGVYYSNYCADATPFVSGESYSQYCPCNWSGADVTVTGLALLAQDGSYLATIGECPDASVLAGGASDAAPAEDVDDAAPADDAVVDAPADKDGELPQTGLVSSFLFVALGGALVSGGAVVAKKSKEN
ncbi:MAG: LPXTG cell wall anchor domain-containing protein [Lachnospiraceae bacterium]|nr:LPXTG cell wall anchor domain-containing protein [Lachnospiraceae bacterium]